MITDDENMVFFLVTLLLKFLLRMLMGMPDDIFYHFIWVRGKPILTLFLKCLGDQGNGSVGKGAYCQG